MPSAVNRIVEFVGDVRNGRDLKKYSEAKSVIPHKTMQATSSNGFNTTKSSGQSPKLAVKRVKYDPHAQPQKSPEKPQ